jgi:acyl carrier protein
MTATTTDRLKKIFIDALDLDPTADITALAYRSIPAWDSVGHMRLVAALETEFNVLLTTDQILEFSDFNHGMAILGTHGVAA